MPLVLQYIQKTIVKFDRCGPVPLGVLASPKCVPRGQGLVYAGHRQISNLHLKSQNPCGETQVLGSKLFQQTLAALQRSLRISLHTVSQRGFHKAESNQVDIQILRGACPWLHDHINGWIALEENPLSKKRGVAGAEGSDILTFFALFSAVRPSNLWRIFQKKLILQQSRITRLLVTIFHQ